MIDIWEEYPNNYTDYLLTCDYCKTGEKFLMCQTWEHLFILMKQRGWKIKIGEGFDIWYHICDDCNTTEH